MHGQLFFLHFIPHVWVSYLCELSVATSMKKQEEEKKTWDEISTSCNSSLSRNCLPPQNSTEFNDELSRSLGLGPMLDHLNTPTELSCSGSVHLPSTCLPGLHAGICHSCHGWRGDHAPGAPERNPLGPHRLSTPAQNCSRTRTVHPHLQGKIHKLRQSRNQPSNVLHLMFFSAETHGSIKKKEEWGIQSILFERVHPDL